MLLAETLSKNTTAMEQRVLALETLLQQRPATPNLENDINANRGHTPTSQASVSYQPPRAATPTKYSGSKSEDFRTFVAQIKTVQAIEQGSFPTDRLKSMHMITFLVGAASAWALPYLEESFNTSYCLLDNFPAFFKKFTKVFDDPLRAQHANRKLSTLRQTGTAAFFAADFRKIAADTTLDENSQQVFFFNGLKRNLQKELVRARIPPTTKLAEYIDATIELAENLHLVDSFDFQPQRQQNLPPPPHQSPSAPRYGPLTSAEKEQRKTANACKYCGWTGNKHKDSCKLDHRQKRKESPMSINYLFKTESDPKEPTQDPVEQ